MSDDVVLKVELVDIPAYKEHPQFGKIPVDHNRLYVLLNGSQCGYVAKEPSNAPFICLSNSLPGNVKQFIESEIARLKGVESLAPRVDAPVMEQVETYDGHSESSSWTETE